MPETRLRSVLRCTADCWLMINRLPIACISQVSTPSRGTIKGAVWNAHGFAKNYMDWAESQGFDFLIWPESKGNGNKQEAAAEREMGPHRLMQSLTVVSLLG